MHRYLQLFWKVILPIALIVAVGWFFYEKLRRPELWAEEVHIRPLWLIPAGLLYLAAHLVWGRFSITLLRNQGATVSVPTGLRAYFISQFGKYIPGKVWVILLRVAMLGNIGISKTAVGITAFYEALTSMAAGALIGTLLIPFLAPEQQGLQGYSVLWIAPFAMAPIGLVGLNRFVNRVNRWRRGPHAKQLPRVKLHWVVLGMLQNSIGWLCMGLSLWLTVEAVIPASNGLTLEKYAHFTSINAIAYVVGFVALFMPAGAGIRELALQILLAQEFRSEMSDGAAQGLAAVVAILLRLVWTVAELAMAAILYYFAPSAAKQAVSRQDTVEAVK